MRPLGAMLCYVAVLALAFLALEPGSSPGLVLAQAESHQGQPDILAYMWPATRLTGHPAGPAGPHSWTLHKRR